MEFVIAKKDFDSAVKQILFGHPATSTEPIDLTVEQSTMKLEATGTNVEVPVEVETPGSARLLMSEIAGLKKISRTYKAGPVRISIDGTRIRFQSTSVYLKRPEKDAAIERGTLFPDEDPPVSSENQDEEFECDNDEEATVGAKLMNESEMRAELERLRAENAQLKNRDKGGISLKVSEKGAVSLYGIGRFPVTLYKEQWLRILASAAEIEKFIRDNESKLKTKD